MNVNQILQNLDQTIYTGEVAVPWTAVLVAGIAVLYLICLPFVRRMRGAIKVVGQSDKYTYTNYKTGGLIRLVGKIPAMAWWVAGPALVSCLLLYKTTCLSGRFLAFVDRLIAGEKGDSKK